MFAVDALPECRNVDLNSESNTAKNEYEIIKAERWMRLLLWKIFIGDFNF